MPELPEVETVRRGLQPVVEGHVIEKAEVRRPDLRRPMPADLAKRLSGRRVLNLRRRSKYLLADLDSGETLILHLGMSGRILISGKASGGFHHQRQTPGKHDHLVLDIDNGARITFNDARRFGSVDLVATDKIETHPLLAHLGPEPLSNAFDEQYLAARLRGRKAPIKNALLDQRIVSGLGNIYVCEALHRAGISPRRRSGNISPERLSALVRAIREVLQEAIESGGSTLRDHRQANGELGYFQHAFKVYDRENQPCLRPGCDGTVRRITQSGRSTYFCPRCQT